MKQNFDAVNILPTFDASSDVSLNPGIRLNIGQYIPHQFPEDCESQSLKFGKGPKVVKSQAGC